MFKSTAVNFVSSKNASTRTSLSGGNSMQIQTKVFNCPDSGNHVIMIARGVFDTRGLMQMISEVAAASIVRSNSKILIDLMDSECTLDPKKIDNLFADAKPGFWPAHSKVAFVSSLKDEEYLRLSDVSTALVSCGFKIAVFQGAKAAVDWLAT